MTDTLFPVSDSWLKKAKKNGLFDDKFAPFRHHIVVRQEDGNFFTHWVSWFPNDRNELQKFSEDTPEEITDLLIIGRGFRIEIEEVLNDIEKEEYGKRVKYLSPYELKRQLNLWRALEKKSPLMSPNERVVLEYVPIKILTDELQERIIDKIVETDKKEKVANERKKSSKNKLPVWTKNKSEFCQYIRQEYKDHSDKYKSERDAAFKLFKQFSFSDRKWTNKQCYELLKQLPK